MIRFRLSDETRMMLAAPAKVRIKQAEKSNYYNSPEFYKKHPDLTPANIYLAEGRVVTRKEMNKRFNEAFKLSLHDRLEILFGKVKQIFGKDI